MFAETISIFSLLLKSSRFPLLPESHYHVPLMRLLQNLEKQCADDLAKTQNAFLIAEGLNLLWTVLQLCRKMPALMHLFDRRDGLQMVHATSNVLHGLGLEFIMPVAMRAIPETQIAYACLGLLLSVCGQQNMASNDGFMAIVQQQLIRNLDRLSESLDSSDSAPNVRAISCVEHEKRNQNQIVFFDYLRFLGTMWLDSRKVSL
jgi:hypothetical protein